MQRNERAYRRWIAKKERDGDFDSDDDDDYGVNNHTMAVSREVSSVAFQKLLEDKRVVPEEAGRRRRESLWQAADRHERKVSYDRRVTVSEFCETDPIAPRPSTPTDYISAFRNWMLKKRRHEALKTDDDDDDDDDGGVLTREQVNDMRQVLVLDGMSHDEWLGQKERERVLGNRPLVLDGMSHDEWVGQKERERVLGNRPLVLDGMSHDEWLGQKERERVLGNRPLVLAPKRRRRAVKPCASQSWLIRQF